MKLKGSFACKACTIYIYWAAGQGFKAGLWRSACKNLTERLLRLDSDVVRTKSLVLKRLWLWKGQALDKDACSRSPSKLFPCLVYSCGWQLHSKLPAWAGNKLLKHGQITLMGLEWRRQRYLWAVLGWLLALMLFICGSLVVNTNRAWFVGL